MYDFQNFSIQFLIFLGVIINNNAVLAQHNPIKFNKLKVDDGLSDSWITEICKDSEGFIWIGTFNGGVNKFNGYSTKVYAHDKTNKHSIASNRIGGILSDSKGRLWVANRYEGGLNLYMKETDSFKKYLFNTGENGPSGSEIKSLCENKDGKIWIATNNGVDLLDPESGTFKRFKNKQGENSLINNQTSCVFLSSRNKLWIGTYHGLSVLELSNGNFKNYSASDNDPNSIPFPYIGGIYEDENGEIWLSTFGGGFCRYNQEEDNFITYQQSNTNLNDNYITAMTGDKEGNLYLGTEDGGLNIMNIESGEIFAHMPELENEFSLDSRSIHEIFYDNVTKTIWTGSFNAGVAFFGKYDKNFMHYKPRPNGLNNGQVLDILQAQDKKVWIATDGGGLNVLDEYNNAFINYQNDPKNKFSLSNNAVTSIFEDNNGDILAGTYRGGLNIFDSSTRRFYRYNHKKEENYSLPSDRVREITQDNFGNILLKCSKRWVLFDRKTEKFIPDSTALGFVIQEDNLSARGFIFQDNENNYWMANGSKGLGWLPPTGSMNWTYFVHSPEAPNNISDNNVNFIFEDSKNQIWIGTENGLNYFNKESQTFKSYNELDGLPSKKIMSLQEDDEGNFWIGTMKGLTKFKNGISIPENPEFINYTLEDGIQGMEFNVRASFKGLDGKMYFGGKNGFNSFYPSEIKDNPVAPPVKIVGFKLFNQNADFGLKDSPLKKSILATETIVLNHTQNVITFDFVALNFSQPSKNNYAFRMEGFEENWNYVGSQRSATYTSLEAGKYFFHVKASNNDGVWNEEGVKIKIIILPPWWNTWWFRGAVILILIAGISGLYKYRIFKLNQQKKILTDLVTKRTAELQIAHDEIQTQNEELKTQQEELSMQNEELLTMLDKLKKTQSRLVQAEKMASLGLLTAGIAHEINNPVNFIKSGITGLKKMMSQITEVMTLYGKINSSNVKEKLYEIENVKKIKKFDQMIEMAERITHNIETGVNRTVNIIKGLQAFSRSDLKNHTSYNLQEGINNCLLLLNHLISERIKIKINLKFNENIECSASQINQVIMNLLVNAIQAIQNEGEILITSQKVGENVLLKIKDSGEGIPPENLGKIFDPFFTTKEVGQGTGLGLSIVLGIVEEHSGKIEVESEIGTGTLVKVTLPIQSV
ncbi:two-component regulator propeller domain-containing protein [Flexithrix dorotheae]|uniref:two-component regulator propeller domain-containing protein n=1 Tax=Flexithrix dorotheae TaxID=70993 RepID=UPI00035D1861|nr:two-component regulator propeller domain-containing protein [Flexithrix dorotheae]